MIRDYVIEDYEQIVSWCEGHEILPPKYDDLPRAGYIEPHVAVGFLIWTDTSTAILDFFITNPRVGAVTRARAIESIVLELIARAKALGFRRLKCDSQKSGIKKIAKRFNFNCFGDHTVFCKEI